MNLTIREIEEKDYLEVATFYKELREVGTKYMFSYYGNRRRGAKMKTDNEVVNDIIVQKHKEKDSKFLVLEIDNKVVGFIYGILFHSSSEVYILDDYVGGELCNIFVEKRLRGKGYSNKLRDELFNWFKEQKVKIIEIGVNQDNPSYEIYKKWGFDSKYCYVSKEF